MKLKLTILFGSILITEMIFLVLFPRWTFVLSGFKVANRIVLYFSIIAFSLSFLSLLRLNRTILNPLSVLLCCFFIINSFFEIYPIDTTSEPIDVSIFNSKLDGQKVVIREYKNMKTNHTIRDTVLVKDIFIFRQIYDVGLK